ncbi:MAG: hypothetical protein AABX79_03115 [Nanoarchaeota archaeon]
MGFLGFGKKKRILDLTENYKRQLERAEQARASQKKSSDSTGAGPFSFFDSPSSNGSSDASNDISPLDDKKKKLAARILEMTEKLEDIGNQVYHLQQRLELLERKSDVKRI